ncbi:MAG: C_GCAxxG_C_C family protein, partial [Desulfobacterales bacterium]|nr:C_GCAxxG_C_C family protein [Desulfobacterales bacterium]
AAQRLVESFRARTKKINCLEITGLDKSSSTRQMISYFLIKGGTIGCLRMAVEYAPLAFTEINTALSEKHTKEPSTPVSCSAMLAQNMGVSDMHKVMAAGFAGGIGLNGGACGALGTAIWIIGMNGLKGDGGKIDFKRPEATAAINRFSKYTDFEFECCKIVGRRFENVSDHAGYLRKGGCSKIIQLLSTN